MAAVPSMIGPYQIRRQLGAGGMGAVYLGEDPSLQRLVAIKVLHENLASDYRERFKREAHTAGRLRHHNLITVFGFGDDQGRPYLVMEYLPGETLGAIITRKATLSIAAKLTLMQDVCAGVGHAHKMGILHRDIKPANVMVDTDGLAKIVDFGIAKRAESTLTLTGWVLGTLNYLSPEQLRGDPVDHRSDIFAVGALFYELVAGTKAFPGGIDDGVLGRIMIAEPKALGETCSDLPAGIEGCIVRALAKKPEDRFPDLDAMGGEIATIARSLSVDARLPQIRIEIGSVVQSRSFDLERAAEVLREPSDEVTHTVAAHVTAARQALDASRFEEAIRESERALALDAGSGEAVELIELARAALDVQRSAGQPAQSRAAFRWKQLTLVAAAAVVLAAIAIFRPWNPRPADPATPQGPVTTDAAASPLPTQPQPAPIGESPGRGTADPVAPANSAASEVPRSENLDQLIEQARNNYKSGQRLQALNTVQKVMLEDAGRSRAAPMVQEWLTTARSESETARRAADALGAAAASTSDYQAGRRAESDAARVVNVDVLKAVRDYWNAAGSYARVRWIAQTPTGSVITDPTSNPESTKPASDPSRSSPVPTGLPVGPPADLNRPPISLGAPPAAPPPAAPPATPAPDRPAIPQGALDALTRYAAAYRAKDVAAVKKAFPSLPREREAVMRKAFAGCRAYDVQFGKIDPVRVTDESMTLYADTTYSCTPTTGGSPRTETTQDVFQLKRVGTTWVIVNMQLM